MNEVLSPKHLDTSLIKEEKDSTLFQLYLSFDSGRVETGWQRMEMNAMLPSSVSSGRGEWRTRRGGKEGDIESWGRRLEGGDRIDLKVPSNYSARVILSFSSLMRNF